MFWISVFCAFHRTVLFGFDNKIFRIFCKWINFFFFCTENGKRISIESQGVACIRVCCFGSTWIQLTCTYWRNIPTLSTPCLWIIEFGHKLRTYTEHEISNSKRITTFEIFLYIDIAELFDKRLIEKSNPTEIHSKLKQEEPLSHYVITIIEKVFFCCDNASKRKTLKLTV